MRRVDSLTKCEMNVYSVTVFPVKTVGSQHNGHFNGYNCNKRERLADPLAFTRGSTTVISEDKARDHRSVRVTVALKNSHIGGAGEE